LILVVVVHAASIQDRDGAKLALRKLGDGFGRQKLIWADGGYAGQLVAWVAGLRYHRILQIVKRNTDVKGLSVLPKRWIVERTFGWLGRYRRHSRDYEALADSSEAMLRISMINLMLHRLKPG
jgi:putative transposase